MLFSIQGIVDALGARPGVPFAVVLPDGSRCGTGDGEPRSQLNLNLASAD